MLPERQPYVALTLRDSAACRRGRAVFTLSWGHGAQHRIVAVWSGAGGIASDLGIPWSDTRPAGARAAFAGPDGSPGGGSARRLVAGVRSGCTGDDARAGFPRAAVDGSFG